MMPARDNTKPNAHSLQFHRVCMKRTMGKASSRSDRISSDKNNWNGLSIARFTSIKINLGKIVCLCILGGISLYYAVYTVHCTESYLLILLLYNSATARILLIGPIPTSD